MSKENKTKKIFRQVKDESYCVIKNDVFLDKRISWGAKGVLGYALTKPDDWDLYISEVTKNGSDKIDKVTKYFKELRLAGYIEYVITRERGKITKTEYLVYEKPLHLNPINMITRHQIRKAKKLNQEKPKLESPIQEKPRMEKPFVENTSLLNTDNILNTDNNKILMQEVSFPSQDKVTLFFEHHKKQLMTTRKHGDPDLHLVDKLGNLIEWNIETYDKILKAKQNSTWEVRRNQPNTAKWLLATMENENLETVKSNVITFPKYDLEELRKEGFV